jgi:hypothetical protein
MPIGLATGLLVGGLASAAGSVASSAIGSSAAGKAATAQANAADQSAVLAKQSADEQLAFQKQQYADTQKLQAPWIQAGTNALTKLQAVPDFAAPTASEAQNDPGYAFRVAQGQQAIERSAAARGGVLSGGTAKSLDAYTQGEASNEYNNVYNRDLTTYNTNRNNLASLAGVGQTATQQLTAAGQNNANALTSISQNDTAAQIAAAENAGNARASGYASQGNIWGQGVGNIFNSVDNYMTLSSILNRLPKAA